MALTISRMRKVGAAGTARRTAARRTAARNPRPSGSDAMWAMQKKTAHGWDTRVVGPDKRSIESTTRWYKDNYPAEQWRSVKVSRGARSGRANPSIRASKKRWMKELHKHWPHLSKAAELKERAALSRILKGAGKTPRALRSLRRVDNPALLHVHGRGWIQESYETGSPELRQRAKSLRAAGYRVTSASLGSQVTQWGRAKLTMLDIRPGSSGDPDLENVRQGRAANPGSHSLLYGVTVPPSAQDRGYYFTIRAKTAGAALAEARRYCARNAGMTTAGYKLPRGSSAKELKPA